MMDLYDGDLATVLREAKKNKSLEDNYEKVIRYAKSITCGLQFLHENGIIHGDLKPGNVLIKYLPNNTETLVIGDLDDLILMQENTTCTADVSQLRGTPRYMSPEMLRKFLAELGMVSLGRPGRKTDIWSLGCIILEMAECCLRYHVKQLENTHNDTVIQAGDAITDELFKILIADGYRPYVCDAIPRDLAASIRQCLQRDSESRITADALLQKLHKTRLIVFFQHSLFFPFVWLTSVFDPLTGTVEELKNPEDVLTNFTPVLNDSLTATDHEMLLYRENNGIHELHLWNVCQQTWRSLILPVVTHYENPIVVDNKIYFWDEKDEKPVFKAVNLSEGSTVELNNMPRLELVTGITTKLGPKIFYATGRMRPFSTWTWVKCFDTITGQWEFFPDLLQGHSRFAMVATDKNVYILGGKTLSRHLGRWEWGTTASCIRLNTRTATWEEIYPLRQPRYNHAACIVGDRIYVCGGMTASDEYAQTVEVYDTELNGPWSTITGSMTDEYRKRLQTFVKASKSHHYTFAFTLDR
ncbi:uncharacterized protein LOC129584342 isoform X2 [Paramacrobiotus metropolitanus]|nr:uncharacterized protein LOC129584342 isoform X2 [Paramacrobiotus metropolitanus]